MAPVSNIVPFGAVMAERYFYLPSIGLCIFTAAVFLESTSDSSPGARLLTNAFLACCILIFGAVTFQRNYEWRDELYLWKIAAAECPNSSKAQTGYGRRLLELARDRQQMEEAIGRLELAARLDPAHYEALLALGTAYWRAGNPGAALDVYTLAMHRHPTNDVRYNLALALNRLGRPAEALPLLLDAVRFQPDWTAAHYLLGSTYLKLDRLDDAEKELKSVLEKNPVEINALGNLAVLYYKKGRTEESERILKQILKIDPDNPHAMRNLDAVRKSRSKLK